MSNCKFCGNQTVGQHCPYCGQLQEFLMEVSFIYGPSKKDAAQIDLWITNRYLIVHTISQREQFGRSLSGGLGGLIGFGIGKAVQGSAQAYGFYDLAEISYIRYPYDTFGVKPGSSFQVVLQSGQDFIINAIKAQPARKAIDALAAIGIQVITDREMHGNTFCTNPAENASTLGSRLCPSAQAFVRRSNTVSG